MSDWQPIDTAPKDGTDVLLFNGHPRVGSWFDSWEYDSWHPEAKETGGWIMYGGRVIHPTHWQPLPEPPLKTSK